MKFGLKKVEFPYKKEEWKSKTSFWFIRAVLPIFFLLLVAFFFRPKHPIFSIPKIGEIAKKEIIAEFSFDVEKEERIFEKEREDASENIPLVLDYDGALSSILVSEPERFFRRISLLRKEERLYSQKEMVISSWNLALSGSTISLLLSWQNTEEFQKKVKDWVRRLLEIGVVADFSFLKDSEFVSLRRENVEKKIEAKAILSKEKVMKILSDSAGVIFQKNEQQRKGFIELVSIFLIPNLTPNFIETEKRRNDAISKVSPLLGSVQKDERIIDSHKPIRQDDILKLRSYYKEKQKREGGRKTFLGPFVGREIIVILFIILAGFYLYRFRIKDFRDDRFMLSLFFIFAIGLSLSGIVFSAEKWTGGMSSIRYLTPFALAPLLATILFDIRLGLFVSICFSILLGSLSELDMGIGIVSLLGGMGGVYGVRNLRHRWELLRSCGFAILGNLMAIGSVIALKEVGFSEMRLSFIFGSCSGILSFALLFMLLPLFETLFRLTTNYHLLELADFNRPLLKRLSLKALGTYRHSLLVSNLAESAAEAIGANALLCRVGAYYHDIGKMEKPEYFIENQLGRRNPHEALSPKMSALIVASHVKDGKEMASKERLPLVLVDFIEQHHGTTLIGQFYQKAQRLSRGEKVLESDYRYPGPKPRSKEVALVMLADSVEAIVRSIKEPNPARIRRAVREILLRRFSELELDECELTMKDLRKIEESFVPVLVSVFHSRIEYEKPGESLSGEDHSSESKREMA